MTDDVESRAAWMAIRRKGRARITVAVIVLMVLAFIVGFFAGNDGSVVAGVILLAIVAALCVSFWLWQRRTGTSLKPDWAPERDTAVDDEADEDDERLDAAAPAAAAATPPPDHFDAQILGVDLARLGQPVPEVIKKSYATGNLVIADDRLTWEPAPITARRGVSPFVLGRGDVTSVDVAELWGSWSLLSLSKADGTTIALRVPTGARPQEALAAR